MSYDSRKIVHGQEVVDVIEIHADACKYSTTAMLAARDIVLDSGTSIPSSGTGTVLTIDTGDASSFNASSYLRVNTTGEVVAVTVDTATQLTITARSQFGTAAAAASGALSCRIMHQGEADGTCYGFPGSCSSSDSWDGTAKHVITLPSAPMPAGTIYTNGLIQSSIRKTGADAKPGRSMGGRAGLSFEALDELDATDLFNPYRDRIAPNGTKYGKLLARHPHFTGRHVVHKWGLRDPRTYDLPEFKSAKYVIDSLKREKGKLSVSCLDPLIFTDEKKAKVPAPSEGKLDGAITGSPSTFDFKDVGDYYYGSNGSTVYVRIDSEVIKCTCTAVKTLTVVTRGYRSTAKDHSDGATIQLCAYWANTHIVDMITDIFSTYTQIDSDFIGTYTATKALIPGSVIDEAIITKPVAVKSAIDQLIAIGDLIVFYDEEAEEIVIDYVPETAIEPINFDDNNHFKFDSVTIDRNEDEQYTRFSFAWGLADVTKDTEENFEIIHTVINGTLESGRYRGSPNEKKSEKTSLLSNSTDDSLLGASYVSRTVERSSDFPKILKFKIDGEHIGSTQGGTVAPGKIISVTTREIGDITGTQTAELYQIERINGSLWQGYDVTARRYLATAPATIDYTVDGTFEDYDLSAHYAPSAGNYVVYITPETVIGTSSAAAKAFTTGTQAAGVTFDFVIRGQLLSHGGAGGDGGVVIYDTSTTEDDGTDGSDGGIVFDATVDCTIDVGSGLIWAGGGGESGSRSSAQFFSGYWSNVIIGDGGDGGQGYGVSQGGAQGEYDTQGAGTNPFHSYGTNGANGGPSSGNGAWGQNGGSHTGATGGLAGIAINKNGNTVTIVAGDNDLNIKGRRV